MGILSGLGVVDENLLGAGSGGKRMAGGEAASTEHSFVRNSPAQGSAKERDDCWKKMWSPEKAF